MSDISISCNIGYINIKRSRQILYLFFVYVLIICNQHRNIIHRKAAKPIHFHLIVLITDAQMCHLLIDGRKCGGRRHIRIKPCCHRRAWAVDIYILRGNLEISSLRQPRHIKHCFPGTVAFAPYFLLAGISRLRHIRCRHANRLACTGGTADYQSIAAPVQISVSIQFRSDFQCDRCSYGGAGSHAASLSFISTLIHIGHRDGASGGNQVFT